MSSKEHWPLWANRESHIKFLEGVRLEEGHVGQFVDACAILVKCGRGKGASVGALAIPEIRGADQAVDTKNLPIQ